MGDKRIMADDELKKEIEDIRKVLNKIVEEKNEGIIKEEILETSRRLDGLIIKFASREL